MTIMLTNPTFYAGGEGGSSSVVGFESQRNRVVRYNLIVPSDGANRIDLSFSGNWKGGGTTPSKFGCKIGTDPDEYANAGTGYEPTTVLNRIGTSYDYVGSADVLIIPNVQYYVWVYPISTTFGWFYWGKASGDATIETYGGAISTVDPLTITLGDAITIPVIRYLDYYQHSLRFELGSVSGIICEITDSLSINWTPDIALSNQIINGDSAALTIMVDSYEDGDFIGTSTVQFTALVPATIVPTVTATIIDLSAGYDTFGVYVQNVSRLQVNSVSNGAYGSTILSTSIAIDGSAYEGDVLLIHGDLNVVVSVVDSRGRIGSTTVPIVVAEYARPQISVSASRCDEDGTPNEIGEYASVTLATDVFPVSYLNEASVLLTYGETETLVSISVGTHESRTIVIPAPSVSSVRISATVSDRLMSSDPSTMVLSVGYATMDFLAGGRGIAFGATATEEGFTCAMPARFTGGVNLGTGLLDYVYPVGSIYLSFNNTDPSFLFGGIWERLANTFLWACGEEETVGETGGESEHILTLEEIPGHDHPTFKRDPNAESYPAYQDMVDAYGTGETVYGFSPNMSTQTTRKQMRTGTAGEGEAHNNMPPYTNICAWRRTA